MTNLCPSAPTMVCSIMTWLQYEQCFPSVNPVPSQVADTAASMTSVWILVLDTVVFSSAEHLEQTLTSSPSSLQVACLVVFQSPKVCWHIVEVSSFAGGVSP